MTGVCRSCDDPGCAWEVLLPSQDAADRAYQHHRNRQHAEPPPPARRPVGDWWSRAVDTLIAYAKTHAVFTLHEALTEVGDPPDAQHTLGTFARDAAQMQLITAVGFTESKRPGTKGSAVKTWMAGPAITGAKRPVGAS